MNTWTEAAREIPVAEGYDVIVCGGGPAGFVAATAAGRAGARTLLVERYGFLGGTATAALMVEFGSIHDGARVIVGGISHEFLHRLADFGGLPDLPDGDSHRMVFDPESIIAVCGDMVAEAGVEVLLHTLVVQAVREGGRVRGVVVENKSGRSAVLGKTVIDATGDGDVAARAGAAFGLGRDGDGRMQPVTLEIILGNVDATRFGPEQAGCLTEAISRARRAGEWTIPTDQLFSAGRVVNAAPDRPTEAFYFINGTNVLNVDGTSAADLTRAELEARRQVDVLVGFLRGHAPGFENCYLHRTAAQVGVRETRRIRGDYTLTGEEVLAAAHFDDGVACSHQSINVHDVGGKCFDHAFLQPGTHYEIPYRCFLPAGLEGLLVAGRCISVDHAALGSVRRMVTCMPMGEACGRAAALAAAAGCSAREVPVARLRQDLAAAGTPVGQDDPP